MCGIAGVVYTSPGKPVEASQLAQMADVLAYRGPDDSGLWTSESVGFAHRRLAIVAPQGGRQPMVSAESGAVLIFNGEIYNCPELRRELQQHGCRFPDASDTAVVLRAFEQWGEACVERLHGMFAFAVWNPRNRRFFAARDRLGIKPFFYRWTAQGLTFASELKALAVSGDRPLQIDERALESYLRLQYVPGPSCIFEGVRQLPAGHVLSLADEGQPHERRYWRARPLPPNQPPFERSDVEECRSRLASAVKSHLVADVPIGVFLSGGLDSSLIVAHMAALGPVKSFSIGFDGDARFDERRAARRVAQHFGTVHRERIVTDRDAAACVPALVPQMDQPLGDYAALPTYLMADMAARDVKVVLTGEGADELFAGYRRYRRCQWFDRLPLLGRSYQASHLFSTRELTSLLGHRPRYSRHRAVAPPANLDPLNRVLVRDIEGWLPDNLLTKVDRMTMLCSIEARVPYLDHSFVEFALSVPGRRKLGMLRGSGKALLRKSAVGLLPPDVLERRKQGFAPPMDAWFRGRLGAFAREVLLDPSSRLRGHMDMREVSRLLTMHERGGRNGHKIWSLLVYDLWSRHYGAA